MFFFKPGVFKTFRLSISWARILPNGDDETQNEEGLKFYGYAFSECKRHGIEPIVTISHYEMPLALTLKQNAGPISRRSMLSCAMPKMFSIVTKALSKTDDF
ncbi:family 1 glycosylhydrolase [Ligilactobacillus ruminis]|uniref:family 1 glycosylhydrolase n=2 Tax=Ligilactobacillus ruminis TaxID=1623 RepID=UPI0034390F22